MGGMELKAGKLMAREKEGNSLLGFSLFRRGNCLRMARPSLSLGRVEEDSSAVEFNVVGFYANLLQKNDASPPLSLRSAGLTLFDVDRHSRCRSQPFPPFAK